MQDQAVRPPLQSRQSRLMLEDSIDCERTEQCREIRHEIELEKNADDAMSNRPTRVTHDSHWHYN